MNQYFDTTNYVDTQNTVLTNIEDRTKLKTKHIVCLLIVELKEGTVQIENDKLILTGATSDIDVNNIMKRMDKIDGNYSSKNNKPICTFNLKTTPNNI
jgi:hypothetical protein